ncbi:MAG TPA: lysophospholipid acyltransferase family protein [Actinomycetales bacterium]|jgi:1-acyl-sn-glycerol-3-phosphate acyltransferase
MTPPVTPPRGDPADRRRRRTEGDVVPIDRPRRARRTTGAAAVTAGADRAGSERARRRRPALFDVDEPATAPVEAHADVPAAVPTDVHAEVPVEVRVEEPAAADDLFASLREPEPDRAWASVPLPPVPLPSVPPPSVPLPSVESTAPGAATSGGALQALVESLVEALVAEAERAGVEDVDRRVAEALAWVRRRLEGDYEVDDFGFDRELTAALLPLLRPLYRSWFRVEVRGIENIPSTGGALIVANHSGAIALDAVMTQLAIHDEHPAHRDLRLLGADLVFTLPVVSELARKTGATLAATADAERLLAAGELVGVWPEGFKGIGKPFSERYKLQRFGRGGFVAAALKAQVPIVPCAIVGAEETYPILGDLTGLARMLGLPFLPITPTFPWLGPLGLLPLPSKWLIEFGEPMGPQAQAGETSGPADADDPMLVFDLTDQVRETIQQTLYTLLLQRRSVFY